MEVGYTGYWVTNPDIPAKAALAFRTPDFVQPALSYIINSHPSFVFRTPNSDFRTHLTNTHFELSHRGTVKQSPELILSLIMPARPIPVAVWTKAWVCGGSIAGTNGSNTAGGMDVCLVGVVY